MKQHPILWLALGATLLGGCSAAHAQAPPPLPAVAVERVRTGGDAPVYAGPASVEPQHVYRVAFELSGRVASVNADVGDRVARGETLASLDGAQYGEQLAAARAQAAAAAANAQKTLDGNRPQERMQSRAQYERALSATQLADANAARSAQLFSEGAISAQDHDVSVQAQRDAHGALEAAQAQLSLADQGPRSEDRAASIANAQAAQADAALAATMLGKTAIVAPADAIVQSRSIEPGDDALPGAVAFVLVDASAPQVDADVPERVAASLHAGDSATVVLGTTRVAGTIARIEPAADPQTRTRQIRIHAGTLRPAFGAVVSVEIGRANAHGVQVPLGAIVVDRHLTYVDTLDAPRNTVARRRVRILDTQGDRVVVSDIAPGTTIVIAGQYQVHAGDAVRVVSQDGAQ